MQAQIRRIGNSSGTIIPSSLLKKLDLKDGDAILIQESEGRLIISKEDSRPKYTLTELLAQCDPDAPEPEEIKEWDQSPPAGQELL